ncbi:MAG: hypothetical protein ABIF85_03410 [Nanoarchaeota archaeon]|nr:hypothetical protein [Nanoarchaeota archaeon]MBU4300593.1 hypothetical protein [Nanoarchaeota archaeon]MBU4451739.1 hypothetical protein [Nanoarchaeota archaeon]MCG2723708.1 hypothetical protein [archaeon]
MKNINKNTLLAIVILIVIALAFFSLPNAEKQTSEKPFEQPAESAYPPLTAEPAPLPLTTNGYVYDGKLNYGFNYPDNWEFSIGVDKDIEQCDPTQYYEAYNCVEFPNRAIKKIITFKKDVPKEGVLVSVDIEFMVKSAANSQDIKEEFKKEAMLSGLEILNETVISINGMNGYDMLAGIPEWKLRYAVFYTNGTAYTFKYSSQDEYYRMYEGIFSNIIKSFKING